MFSSRKFSSNVPVPLMSNIFRSPCSVVSRPFLVRPSRCAIQMDAPPEVIRSRMYCDRRWEERYSSRALMPRMTLIMRLERSRSSSSWLVTRFEPTQISVNGRPACFITYWTSAGSITMSRWLETARKRPWMPFRFSIPLQVKPSDVRARMPSITPIITSFWNWSMLPMPRSIWLIVEAGSDGKRYLETTGIIGCRDIRAKASAASASV